MTHTEHYPIGLIPSGVRLTGYGGEAEDLPQAVLQDYLDEIAAGRFTLAVHHVYELREMQQPHAAKEWSLVLQGPPTAGMVVVAADRGGTLRESFSMAKAYAEERQRQGASELLDDIVSAQPEFDQSRLRSPEALGEQGVARLREAVELLERKASAEDVDAYKQFILGLADRVAHAHKEGGFLGVGGKDVSAKERAALDDIAAAVGTPPA